MPTFTTYRVAAGDTLFGLARRFGMTVDELKAANKLTSNNLSVGQALQVKGASGGGSGSGTITVIKPVQPATPVQPPEPETHASATANFTTYRVVAGDTLFGVARRFGMTVDEVKAANKLTSNNLSVGQSLRVKGASSGSGSGGITVIKPVQPTTPIQPPSGSGTAAIWLPAKSLYQK